MFPLGAAHPAQHYRYSCAIGPLNHAVVGNFRFPSNQVQAQIFDVLHDCRVALGVTSKQEIGAVDATVNWVISAVNLEIEVTARSNVGKAVIGIAFLRNSANAEIDCLSIGKLVIDDEIELQTIEIGLAPLQGPPQVWIGNGKLRYLRRGERDFFRLISQQRNFVLKLDRRLAGPQDLAAQCS